MRLRGKFDPGCTHSGITVFYNEENTIMSKSNKALVPEAKEALNQFKMEAASEVGVPSPS